MLFGDLPEITHQSIGGWLDLRSRVELPVVDEFPEQECAADGYLRGAMGGEANFVEVEVAEIEINSATTPKGEGSAAAGFSPLQRQAAAMGGFGWSMNNWRAAVVACAIF